MNLYLKKTVNTVQGVGNWALLVGETARVTFTRFPAWTSLLDQFYEIGVLSLPVVAITGFSTGMVLAAQAFYQLGDKGLSSVVGLIVGKSMLTEIGPVLTAFMITGRVGSAMCAMIGTMKVTEQLDALKSMNVSPFRYLVAPRVVASVVMVPFLTLFSSFLGIYGGYLVAVYLFGMTPQGYFDPMPMNIEPFDFTVGLVKAALFGFFISSIACYKGMTTTGGAAGVGKMTTSSVVITYSMILIFNFFLTVGLNVLHK
jgi:phospholipid/cholesterol/gamma-HCH transport system permease protein